MSYSEKVSCRWMTLFSGIFNMPMAMGTTTECPCPTKTTTKCPYQVQAVTAERRTQWKLRPVPSWMNQMKVSVEAFYPFTSLSLSLSLSLPLLKRFMSDFQYCSNIACRRWWLCSKWWRWRRWADNRQGRRNGGQCLGLSTNLSPSSCSVVQCLSTSTTNLSQRRNCIVVGCLGTSTVFSWGAVVLFACHCVLRFPTPIFALYGVFVC